MQKREIHRLAATVLLVMAAASPAAAAPVEKETPIVRVGDGSGILLTNTIVATARHVAPTHGGRISVITATGQRVNAVVSHYDTVNPKKTENDFALIKLDSPVSVHGDNANYRMELFTGSPSSILNSTSVRYGSFFRDAWGQTRAPHWSRYDKVKIIDTASENVASVNGLKFTDLFNPFPKSEGSSHWWGYSGGPLVNFAGGQPYYIGANAAHYEYVNDIPTNNAGWPTNMNGRRGVRYTDISRSSPGLQTKYDWVQSFIAANDPARRAIGATTVGGSAWRDSIALSSGAAVSVDHTTKGAAATLAITIDRADGGQSVSCLNDNQMVPTDTVKSCTSAAINVDDLSAPVDKRWTATIARGGAVVRKIPLTIGAALSTQDYRYFQGQAIDVAFTGAKAGDLNDAIALFDKAGKKLSEVSLQGRKDGEAKLPLVNQTTPEDQLSGEMEIRWLRKGPSGAHQAIAILAIEIRPPLVRTIRDNFRGGRVFRPLSNIEVDVAGGAPGWRMDIVRAGETTPAVSRTLRKGYERVTISGDQNPGAGAYEARLCSSDGSGCPAKTTFTVGPTKLIYGTTGPYANQNNQEHWLFDYYGASNRGVCDRVQIVSQGDFANANPQPAMALQRENRAWRNYSDFWCYLTVVEGQTGGSFPMKPLAPGQYVAYVSDGLGDKIEPHAAVSFTSSQTKAMQFPKSYYELGPVGAKQGIYRGAPPIEFGWDGKAEQGRTLTSLIVRHGNILDGLELVYDNGAARADYGNRRANSGDTISLNRGERLVEVSGFYGSWFGARHILQLTLTTSAGRTFGPYGNMEFSNTRKPFKFSAPAGGGIVDFIGASVLVDYNVDPDVERVISALGVIVEAP